MIISILNKVKEKIISILDSDYIRKSKQNPQHVFIQNINKDYQIKAQKKALISYITQPFITNGEKDLPHTNYRESIEILKTLIQLKYNVDICHFQDPDVIELIKEKKYDLILGLGEPFYTASKFSPNAKKIIYCAVEHYDSAIIKVEERMNYHFKRHNSKPIVKIQNYYLKHHFQYADYIIHKGNKLIKSSFEKAYPKKPSFPIISAPYSHPLFIEDKRNISKSKNVFLWFGSIDIYHKGLDILIDVFKKNPEKKLIIAGINQDELKKLNPIPKNVIHIGFIKLKSERFLDLMIKASFIIFPSCSEGMASGVLTCMNHGLIPIITKECGIDIEKDFGRLIENYSVENISKIINEISGYTKTELSKIHKNVLHQTRKKYNIKKYSIILNSVFNEINKSPQA
tara:strand:+ start:255 stop:1454 length:1200 start_codon:yes stop_codon:yes gene_type:complete